MCIFSIKNKEIALYPLSVQITRLNHHVSNRLGIMVIVGLKPQSMFNLEGVIYIVHIMRQVALQGLYKLYFMHFDNLITLLDLKF